MRELALAGDPEKPSICTRRMGSAALLHLDSFTHSLTHSSNIYRGTNVLDTILMLMTEKSTGHGS